MSIFGYVVLYVGNIQQMARRVTPPAKIAHDLVADRSVAFVMTSSLPS